MHAEHAIFLTLLTTRKMTAAAVRTLKKSFATYEMLLAASPEELRAAGAQQHHVDAIAAARATYEAAGADSILAPYVQRNITILLATDDAYPALLAEAPDAPLALFVRGNTTALSRGPLVTIVGSRDHTEYGERAAYSLAHNLARAGVTIVSGLALGVDAVAHRAALDADGVTLGVLGGSVDDACIAPRRNVRLAHALCDRGALLSEYPLGTTPTHYTFPARNRIMAALSHITLVIESAAKSGTLITARNALEYNRDVCAVPGSIFSDMSVGTNALIRDGAKIVTCAQDVLAELPHYTPPQQQQLFGAAEPDAATHEALPDLTPDEARVHTILSDEPVHVDKIVTMSKLETTSALSALSLLEIKGLARDIGGKCYVRTR